MKDLQDLTSMDPTPEAMPGLVRLWESLETVKLEAPGLLYRYEMFGLDHEDLNLLVGTQAITTIFGDELIKPTDVVSNQVLNLLQSQMNKLSDLIASKKGGFTESVDEATKAMTEHLPQLNLLREQSMRRCMPY